MTTVRLIAGREITTRWQQKGFRIGLAIAVVIVALGALAPRLIKGIGDNAITVGVSGTNAQALASAVSQAASAQDETVNVVLTSPEDALSKVEKGAWDAAIVGDTKIIAKEGNSSAVAFLQVSHKSVDTTERLTQAGLTNSQVQEILAVAPLPVTATRSAESTQRRVIASVTVVFLFTQLIAFCTWMAMGVVEEKSSRVVEILLSAVRPLQLLAGKLLGIGALAIFQVVLLGGIGLTIVSATGSLDVPASVYATIATSFLWFVLGFAFFAALSAALASLVSRQEEVSGVMSPVTSLLLVSYLGSLYVANAPNASFSRLLSLIPPISAIAMPARMASGQASVAEVVIAAALMIGATIAILAIAARIYRVAILHSGNRLTLRRAWHGEAVADTI
jgi:ABC-2 type transport system permease protein